MAFSGGLFSRLYNWTNDANNNIDILPGRMDGEDNGFAAGLSTCLLKDGTQTVTANIPFAGFLLNNVGNGVVSTDAANLGQVQSGLYNWVVSGGTADAITATYSPSIVTLVDGLELDFRATAANATTTPTFSPNGLPANTITQKGGSALVAGSIPAALAECRLRYNLANTRWELMNPATGTAAAGTLTGTTLAANVVTSSLTAVGTIGTGVWQGTAVGSAYLTVATSSALGAVQTDNTSIAATSGVISAILTPQGRLSLISGSPINTSDTSAATTVYYVPYTGENIPIYNGTTFACLSIGSQISLALDSNSGHTGYQQSGKLFDLFVYNSSGTPTLATGPAWTNSTTRANNIALKNGIWTNSGTITLRFGTVSGNTASITANQATYVGTMYATANGQCSMVQKPAAAAGGSNTIMGLYNAYNRIKTFGMSQDSTGTWSYGTATWRVTNAAGTGSGLNNRVSFVDGLGQSNISSKITGHATTSVDLEGGNVGVVLNSTSASPAVVAVSMGTASATIQTATASDEFYPILGFNFVQGMEYGGGGTVTWYSTNGSQQLQMLSINVDM